MSGKEPYRILDAPYREALEDCSALPDFFKSLALDAPAADDGRALSDIFRQMDPFVLEERGLRREGLPEQLTFFVADIRRQAEQHDVRSVTIVGGRDKDGRPENAAVQLARGDVVAVVGPTGSGKSRLLADIEWMAQGDTQTGRTILINGEKPPHAWRYSLDRKLVAQLSQNMNFVMDLTVDEFIDLHARSRMVPDASIKRDRILREANLLAGEPIRGDMPVTALSGGQSRSLMIADTAFLSTSPIVLIDEIENAGIDRRTAVELLLREEKIVVIATHDPVLALTAARRLVIRNGGISAVLETTQEERACLKDLEAINRRLMLCRENLRQGRQLTKKDTSV
jgi:ABC-type lipoprotein export system ATPase subunit